LVVTSDIPINVDNSFIYTNPYFCNDAILHFKNTKNKGRKPNIRINAILDSSFTPTTTKYIALKMGKTTNLEVDSKVPKNFNEIDTYFGKKIKKEEMVTVKASNKSLAKSFEKEYVSDIFKDHGEKTLNLFEDDPGLYGQTLFSYLQSNVPNLTAAKEDTSFVTEFKIRGNTMLFYLDQVAIPMEFVANIDLNDIAIIKIFNPPFFLNTDANTGAIAMFSKKNKNTGNGTNSFLVKGYSAPIENLNTVK
jgi:hypothetical protein